MEVKVKIHEIFGEENEENFSLKELYEYKEMHKYKSKKSLETLITSVFWEAFEKISAEKKMGIRKNIINNENIKLFQDYICSSIACSIIESIDELINDEIDELINNEIDEFLTKLKETTVKEYEKRKKDD